MVRRIASTKQPDLLSPPDDRAEIAAAEARPVRLKVAVSLPMKAIYDYRAPEALAPGRFVAVPVGPRRLIGVVWEGEPDPDLPESKLRHAAPILHVPPMRAAMRRFLAWMSDYTMMPLGSVLRLAMGAPQVFEPAPETTGLVATGVAPPEGFRMTPARRRVLEAAAGGLVRSRKALADLAGVSVGVPGGLVTAGLLAEAPMARQPPWGRLDPAHGAHTLSPDQALAAEALAEAVTAHQPRPTLLDGVTGSGKTEVYFEAVAACLAAGKQALILLPEIALSETFLTRFEDRFGGLPALWHSGVTGRARREVWLGVAEGRAPVVIGARSALFLPFADLGLIIVDEEHDQAYKQEESGHYHARDMAIVRAREESCPAVLVSATPSLETVHNADSGRYRRLHLPDRHGGASLPVMRLIDLKRAPPPRGRWLSPPLVEAMKNVLGEGEQALLFLNRRGYAPLTLCRACGTRVQCPNCTAWLVEHRFHDRLQCHHCGYSAPIPEVCPACGAEDSLVPCGPGVERIEEEVAALFPDARRLVMASDVLTRRSDLAEAVRRVREHEVDIVIGTQIVAKGHHFPMLTLVGVVDADLGLSGGDLRAGERTFQLLHQVAGRAGRAERPGTVLLQTHQPEARLMQALAAHDRDGFLEIEAEERAFAGMPPYTRLVAIILSGPEETQVDQAAAQLARIAPDGEGLTVLGPAPAPFALLRGRHRRRFLVRAARTLPVQRAIADWLNAVKLPSAVRLDVDIDPYWFG